jgi:hypothetical protein
VSGAQPRWAEKAEVEEIAFLALIIFCLITSRKMQMKNQGCVSCLESHGQALRILSTNLRIPEGKPWIRS